LLEVLDMDSGFINQERCNTSTYLATPRKLSDSTRNIISTGIGAESRKERKMVLVRQEIGDVLRDLRQSKGQTLRNVASRASVALGYLSEVERGQKEASSEILASLADALEVPISVIMREVADRLATAEGIRVPDTVPAELVENYSSARPQVLLDASRIIAAEQARPRAGFVRR
jgi:transcriptional regulator with XRE-family HTH domain